MADRDHSTSQDGPDTIELLTRIAVGWLNNPRHQLAVEEVPILIERIHEGLAAVQRASDNPQRTASGHIPAVTVSESLASKDHILSMIDGKPYKSLRLHLAAYGLTPEEYRTRYRLKPTYPMVAENYSAARRQIAITMGLSELRKKV